MIRRYQVGELKLYSHNKEQLKQNYPKYANNIIEIPLIDNEAKENIKKLKEYSIHLKDEIYKFNYNGGEIIYRFLTEDGEYLDGIIYKRYDECRLMYPILKDISDINSFYNKFASAFVTHLPPTMLSKKEFDKIKPKPIVFDRSGTETKYVDSLGYIYSIPKPVPWNKKETELYNKLKDNNDCVFGRIKTIGGSKVCAKWFENEEEFFKTLEQFKQDIQTTNVIWEIKRKGFKKLPPKERKVIFRFPYIDFTNVQSKLGLAKTWLKASEVHSFIKKSVEFDRLGMEQYFNDLVNSYIDYLNSVKKVTL